MNLQKNFKYDLSVMKITYVPISLELLFFFPQKKKRIGIKDFFTTLLLYLSVLSKKKFCSCLFQDFFYFFSLKELVKWFHELFAIL